MMQKKNGLKKLIAVMLVCMIIGVLSGCEKKDDIAVYQAVIDGLQENEYYATLKTSREIPVLLISDAVYDSGGGLMAAMAVEVYDVIGGNVKNVGEMESTGTAYPITYDESGIYAASGHSVGRYKIDEYNGTLVMVEAAYEVYDENGTATYTYETPQGTATIEEEDYTALLDKYKKSEVINFKKKNEKTR